MTRSRSKDDRFSKLIRDRDGWRCRRCGAQHVRGAATLDAAHGFTRGIGATRYDEENALALCHLTCHPYVDQHSDAKRELWVREIGEKAYERLAARAHGRRDRV